MNVLLTLGQLCKVRSDASHELSRSFVAACSDACLLEQLLAKPGVTDSEGELLLLG